MLMRVKEVSEFVFNAPPTAKVKWRWDCTLTLCPLGKFSCFLSSADFFQIIFWKILSGIPSECQTDWIQIRLNILLGMIWVQTACKSYQKMTLGGKELRVIWQIGGDWDQTRDPWLQGEWFIHITTVDPATDMHLYNKISSQLAQFIKYFHGILFILI